MPDPVEIYLVCVRVSLERGIMALQFMFGSSISLKSEVIYRRLLEEAEANPSLQVQIIVPEQSTLVTQKKVLQLTDNLGMMQVDVVSFHRLAYRVMEEMHQKVPGILDDTGKSMLLRKIAGEVADSLELYGGNLSRKGFIEQLKSMLSEFLQYRVMPKQLQEIADQLDSQPLLQHKIRDLEVIYGKFLERKTGDVITLEELLPHLSEWVPKSKEVQQSVFVLDGFTGFTPVQYGLLELLMQYGRDVVVLLTMDPDENPYKITGEQELFYMSKQVVARLTAMADRINRETKSHVELKPVERIYETRPVAEPLRALEKGLFRHPVQEYPAPAEAIHLHQAKNPEEEVRYVLTRVLACIREGFRYREIAVICSDMETYIPILEKWFDRADLPVFIDRKKNLSGNPLVELISSALEAVEKQYTYESMFRLLRNPLIGLTRRQVDYLENYVKALGISGWKWQQEWTFVYRGMPVCGFTEESGGEVLSQQNGAGSSEIQAMPGSQIQGSNIQGSGTPEAEKYQYHLASLNDLREQIMSWLLPIDRAFAQKKDVREITTLLYGFLCGCMAEEQLQAQADRFEAAGALAQAREYSQCFGKVMGLLDELVGLMGEEVLSLSAYGDILSSGFENLQAGLIPPSIDRLVIGDLQRTRLDSVEVLFLLGCNDSLIPAGNGKHGLLSDLDREWLKQTEIELAPTSKKESFFEQYYLYLMLTKPGAKLYLIWSGVSSDGKALRPCYLVNRIRRQFPQAEESTQDSLSKEAQIWQPEESMGLLMEGLRAHRQGEENGWWQDLYGWYHRQPQYRPRLEHVLDGLFAAYREEHLSPQVSARIFGKYPLNSVTRLETFSGCAYAHFLTYGLGLSERQEYALNAADYGNIFHEAISRFFGLLQERQVTWQELSEEDRLQYVQESVGQVTEAYGNTILKSSARYRYLVGRLEHMTDKTIWALEKQLQAGSFFPKGSEVAFSAEYNTPGMALEVSPGVTMKLHGRIDRVDLVEKDQEVYVKIVDYKSGSTVLDLTRLYYGLQLQLILYLSAAMELTASTHPGKAVLPAGVYYYNIKNPVVEKPSLPEDTEAFAEAVDSAVLEELRMNGLTNKDSDIARLVDHTEGKKSAVVKNLTRDASGVPTGSSMTASTEEIQQLCGYGKQKAADLCREMLSGQIPVNPYVYKDRTPCDYCMYKGICGFDTGIPGYRYRKLQALDTEEVLALIREEKDV